MKRLVSASIIIVLISLSPASAALNDSPGDVKEITLKEAETLIGKKDAYFFDVRGDSHYVSGHLPGAVSVPFEWKTQGEITERECRIDLSVLPEDKESIVVFYSFGPTTLKSYKAYKAAVAAVQAGYKNVCFLKAGYDGWLNSAQAKRQ